MKIAAEANRIMNDGGIRLRKWSSNSEKVRLTLDDKENSAQNDPHKELGVLWTPSKDEMAISATPVLTTASTEVSTKRALLQASAKIFDPLELAAPFVIRSKVLFQRLRERGVGWDEQLPDDLKAEWQSWGSDLTN